MPVTVWGEQLIDKQSCCYSIDPHTGLRYIQQPYPDAHYEQQEHNFKFDHYNFPSGGYGNTIAKDEMKTLKQRRHVTERDTKLDMKAIMQNQCMAGSKGRDYFLKQRGIETHVPQRHAREQQGAGDFRGLTHTRRSLPQILNMKGLLETDGIGVVKDTSGLGKEINMYANPQFQHSLRCSLTHRA